MNETFSQYRKKLNNLGYDDDYIDSTMLPDWWCEECETDPSVLCFMKLTIVKKLDMPMEIVNRLLEM